MGVWSLWVFGVVVELVWVFGFCDLEIVSTLGVRSRSSGYVDGVGGCHKVSIGTLDPQK